MLWGIEWGDAQWALATTDADCCCCRAGQRVGLVDGYNGENRNSSVSFWADATCLSEILSTKNEL